MAAKVYVFVGTYEKVLFGFSGEVTLDALKEPLKLSPIFTVSSHMEPIKSVACHGQILVSGSQDETINVYNFRKRIEIGTLQHHAGAVTALAFHPGHMLSGASDGNLVLWKCSNWEPLLTLKAHKSGVRSVCVLSAGKAALTLGADKKVKLWDLVKGKLALAVTISKDADSLAWSPNGNAFCVNAGSAAALYSDGQLEKEFTHPRDVLCINFVNDHRLITGCEDGKIRLWDAKTGELVKEYSAHTARVKSVVPLEIAGQTYFVSASSDGTVHLWHIDVEKPLSRVETNSRVTSLSAWQESAVDPTPKRKTDRVSGNDQESHEQDRDPPASVPAKEPTSKKMKKKI